MLTGNTSNTTRHCEARQSQAGRSPGLARHLFGLPQNIVPKIWSFIPSEKAALASDFFEKRSPETEKSSPKKKELDRDLQLCLLNRSILSEEREAFLLKALTQANRSKAQSDFSSILNPVCREKRTTPYLSKLLETAAWQNQTIAFERVIKTALKTDTPLPESTYEWVAECGKPEMLDTLLRETQPDLSEKRQKELKKLAQAQKKSIQKYNKLELPERQKALEAAAQGNPERTALENKRDVLALLQTPDIDVNARNQNNGQTLLHWAAFEGYAETVNALLGAPGINVNAPNEWGVTPLHLAAQDGRTEIVNALLGAPDINVNAANQLGYSPLHLAAAGGHTEAVNALLGAPEVDVSAADQHGDTALHVAAERGFTETVNALLQAPGIDVNTVDDNSSTALHLAATGGHTETVNALLQVPNINVNAAERQFGYTPLHFAAERGFAEIVNALLQAPGINVNTVDDDSSTALHLAAADGHTETVNALLQVPNINVNAVDRFGRTPLHLAAEDGHTEIANALWQAGGI